MFGKSKSAAARQYRKRAIVDLIASAALLWAANSLLGVHHPVAWMRYVLAAMRCAAIVGLLIAVGIDLCDEGDEYQRDLTVRSKLCYEVMDPVTEDA
jgi:hypothetical protein